MTGALEPRGGGRIASSLRSFTRPASNVDEPTPWLLGLIVASVCGVFATLVLVGMYELIGGASRGLGLAAVVAVCGGLGWTLWELRFRPVWRWIVWGLLLGMLAGFASSVALLALGR